jgi:membrane-associated protein
MTEWFLALVPTYGIWLLAGCTFIACLGIPLPSSVLMLAAGGFVASGDLNLYLTLLAAAAGIILGDQTGYLVGRRAGARILDRLGRKSGVVARARDLFTRRGGVAVFLTRWLLAPLGPSITYMAAAAPMSWARFTACAVPGSLIWIALYVGVGYSLMGNLASASTLVFKILGAILAGGATVGLGWWLIQTLRAEAANQD